MADKFVAKVKVVVGGKDFYNYSDGTLTAMVNHAKDVLKDPGVQYVVLFRKTE